MAVSVFAVPSIGRAPASGCHNGLRVPAWKLGFATLIIGGLEMCVIGVPIMGEGPGVCAARGVAYPALKLKENLKTEIIKRGKFLLRPLLPIRLAESECGEGQERGESQWH